MAGALDREAYDAPVRDREILGLPACETLFVDEDQTSVGEEDDVSYQFERALHDLLVGEQLGVFLLRLPGIERAGMTEKPGQNRHGMTP